MRIKTSFQAALKRWAALFLPEDTTLPHDRNIGKSIGYIKYWLWISISVGTALFIGRL